MNVDDVDVVAAVAVDDDYDDDGGAGAVVDGYVATYLPSLVHWTLWYHYSQLHYYPYCPSATKILNHLRIAEDYTDFVNRDCHQDHEDSKLKAEIKRKFSTQKKTQNFVPETRACGALKICT